VKLSKINNLLLVLIILINGYVVLAPVLPAILFRWQSHQGKQQQLTQAIHSPATQLAANPSAISTDQPNHVIIPSMLLNQKILDGPLSQTYKILDQGIWRWPNGSTPDKGGNTVLIGHRFTYTNPRGVFYYLNKVSIGDEIGVFWNNKEYLYKVSAVTVVAPTDTTVEAASSQAELTLFTCTPLLLPKDRLVVVAELEQN
jgi:LPXTG-site transpeptidase (sortase) family protein